MLCLAAASSLPLCSVFSGALLTPNTLIAGDHFQWTDTVKGQVSSSFFLGYTVTNFVGAFVCATPGRPGLIPQRNMGIALCVAVSELPKGISRVF